MPDPLELNEEALARLPLEQRKKAEELLVRWRASHEANPLHQFRIDNHPKQAAFLADGSPIKLFIGGNRSGKTEAGVADDIIQLVDRAAVPEHLQHIKKWEPPFFCRVVTVDFKNPHDVIVDKFRKRVPRDQLRGGRWGGQGGAYDAQSRRLWFRNGSWVEFMSQEQDLDAFSARDLHRVHFDEEPLYERGMAIFNECQMRLIDHNGDTLLTMTPQNGMSWVYDKLYLPWQKRQVDDVAVYTVSIHDNPNLAQAGKDRVLKSLTTMSKEERQAREHGLFVAFEGLIYPEFNSDLIVPEWSELPEDVQHVVVGIDPGIRHAAAAIWVALQPDGSVTAFDEVSIADQPIEVVAAEIKLRNSKYALMKPDWYVIDPAARNRSGQSAVSDQAEYAKHGIYTMPGQNNVTMGISRMRALLQHDKFRVTANCEHLIEGFRRYRWTAPRRSEHAPKETPVKRDDHELDALRYAVISLPILREPDPIDQRTARERMAQVDFERTLAEMGNPRHGGSPYGPGFFQ